MDSENLLFKEIFAYVLALIVAIVFNLLNTFFIEDTEFDFMVFFKQTILLTLFNVILFQCFKEYNNLNFSGSSGSSGLLGPSGALGTSNIVEPESILSGPPNFKAYSRKSLYN